MDTHSGQKIKTKMAISSVVCLSRKTNAKQSLNVSFPLKIKETRKFKPKLNFSKNKIPQRKEPSVYTQDATPYQFSDNDNKQGPMTNAPEGRRMNTSQYEVKQSVQRTISRMLHENRLIRKQLSSGLMGVMEASNGQKNIDLGTM